MRLLDKSLRELAAGLRARQFSASDLWREAREAMEAGEPRMNAYKLRADDKAEGVAREADAAFKSGMDCGILQGIPVSVKDLYGIPGLPTFAGSARELPPEWQSAGPMVRCLMDQMAVIPGKTHTVEFAFGALGLNSHWPTPRNPGTPRIRACREDRAQEPAFLSAKAPRSSPWARTPLARCESPQASPATSATSRRWIAGRRKASRR